MVYRLFDSIFEIINLSLFLHEQKKTYVDHNNVWEHMGHEWHDYIQLDNYQNMVIIDWPLLQLIMLPKKN